MARNMVVLAAVLLYIVPAGAAELVSKAEPLCTSAGLSSSSNVRALSADGRFLAFESWATNLVPGQSTRGKPNVYLRDMVAGTTVLVSHKIGEPATGGSSGSANPLVS